VSVIRLQVSGDDFDTQDGTRMRDTVHIADLCATHLSRPQIRVDRVSTSNTGTENWTS